MAYFMMALFLLMRFTVQVSVSSDCTSTGESETCMSTAPAIGDWWLNGRNHIVECSAINVLNIEVATAVNGSSLTGGKWQIATWGSASVSGNGSRYEEAAHSLPLAADRNGRADVLRTAHKRVRWDLMREPASCKQLRFLCVEIEHIGFSENITNPEASCHEITCERNETWRVQCDDNRCSCIEIYHVTYPTANLTSEEKLSVIEKINITADTASDILDEVIALAYQNVTSAAVTSTVNVLESVVSLNSSDREITRDVVEIVGNLLNSDSEALAISQGMNQSGSRVIQVLEQQLQNVDLQANNGTFTEVQPNIAVKVQATRPEELVNGLTFASRLAIDTQLTPNDISLFDVGIDDVSSNISDIRASINVKTQFTNEGSDASPSPDILRVAFSVIREPSLFSSEVDDYGMISEGEPTGRRRPNTPVISVTIEEGGLRKTQTEVTTIFHPIQTSNDIQIIDDPVCVFWDFEGLNGSGDWSSYGCSLALNIPGNDTAPPIRCTCNHTTNFAVIMNFHSPDQSVAFHKASTYLSYIGCGISIGCLLVTLVVYLLSPILRQKQPNQIFMNICLSLLLLYIAYIAVVIFNQYRNDSQDRRVDEIDIGCFCLAALVQYFTLTSLMWMGVEGVNMYLLFVQVVNATIPRFMTKASLIAWGLPVIVVGVTGGIARDHYVDKHTCFLARIPKIGGLLCPIAVIVVANIIIFTMVIVRLGRTMRNSSAKKDDFMARVKESQSRLQKAVCIFLLLGLTWSTGYLLLIGTAFNHVIQIIFISLNSFQGFFIFAIYCLRQRVVRAQLIRICGCRALGSAKRRSISIASTNGRDETALTRQSELYSTSGIYRISNDMELDESR